MRQTSQPTVSVNATINSTIPKAGISAYIEHVTLDDGVNRGRRADYTYRVAVNIASDPVIHNLISSCRSLLSIRHYLDRIIDPGLRRTDLANRIGLDQIVAAASKQNSLRSNF